MNACVRAKKEKFGLRKKKLKFFFDYNLLVFLRFFDKSAYICSDVKIVLNGCGTKCY